MLPVVIDSTTVDMARGVDVTMAGPFDVLAGRRASDGHLVTCEELLERATVLHGEGS